MKRYKQRNFYTEDLDTPPIVLKELYSYETPVGFQLGYHVFFTKQKYSRTTSKQQTQYTNENNFKRHDIEPLIFNALLEIPTVNELRATLCELLEEK